MHKHLDYIDVHTHKRKSTPNETSLQNVAIGYEQMVDPGQYFSLGIHPWYVDTKHLDAHRSAIETQTADPYCLAIGECGLDKQIALSLTSQEELFRWQVAVAEQQKKPVIVHCVRAHEEVLRLRQILSPSQVWLIHSFRKHQELAERYLALGCDLSIGAYALRPNQALESMIRSIPAERMHLETDNSGISITEVYTAVARIRGTDTEQLKQQMYTNWNRLFRIPN